MDFFKTIDKLTADFLESFDALSEEVLNKRPNDNTWSVAQNIEHLIVINSTYFPLFKSIKQGDLNIPIHGKLAFVRNRFAKMILNSVDPSNLKPIKTFEIWKPSDQYISADIIARFEQHQSELKSESKSLEAQIADNIPIHSPANKFIIYGLRDAIHIIVKHEERHLLQAQLLLESFSKL